VRTLSDFFGDLSIDLNLLFVMMHEIFFMDFDVDFGIDVGGWVMDGRCINLLCCSCFLGYHSDICLIHKSVDFVQKMILEVLPRLFKISQTENENDVAHPPSIICSIFAKIILIFAEKFIGNLDYSKIL
jgi:hypothetical protein